MESERTGAAPLGAAQVEGLLERAGMVAVRWSAEPGWPIESVSPSLRPFGFSSEELAAAPLSYARLVHPDDRSRLEEVLERFAGSESEEEMAVDELRLVCRSGEVRRVEQRVWPGRDGAGRLTHLEGLLAVRARTGLDVARARTDLLSLRALLDALPLPVFYKDADLVYRGCNPAFERMLGRSRAEIEGASLYDLSPLDLASTYERMDRALLESGGTQVYEAEVFFGDGTRHEVVFHKAVFRDDSGAVAGLIGAVLDVSERNQAMAGLRDAQERLEGRVRERTAELERANRDLEREVAERRSAERQLRESEERFRELADSLPQSVFELDGQGCFAWLNRNSFAMFGYPPDVRLGDLSVVQMIAPEDRERAQSQMMDVFAGHARDDDEYTALRSDGSRFKIAVSIVPIRRDGRTLGARGLVIDISQRAELDQLKTEFLAIASHELRTPLTPLLLSIQRARRGLTRGLPVEAATLEKMERQSARLGGLIDDLLDLSRLERGTLVIRPERVEAGELAESVVAELRRQQPDRVLRLARPAASVRVVADPVRLEQVLVNLIENAFKYAPGSPVDVRLSGGERAVFEVADRGPGFSPEQRARLFTRYFRAGAPTSTTGLGLGLYICREIVSRMGGTIEVESEPGSGATVRVALPLAHSAEAAEAESPRG